MKSIHSALLDWYEHNGRHELPWRNTKNLYHVYVSEIMLQQTQVSRVEEYFYPNFLHYYPTIQDLANANLDEVLSNWSGLGYYSRARNLHKTAQICSQSGLPKDQKELEKLPGIGRYTASAICSFALKQSVAVVDTNIARVIKRFFALQNPKEQIVWDAALQLLNHTDPTHHNLALMDLGSQVCTPKNPQCTLCPLEKSCLGKDDPQSYTQTKKTQYENMELFYGLWIKENKIALLRSNNKLYHGMLELPTVDPIEENFIGAFKHSYTKYRLDVKLYSIDEFLQEVIWVELDEIDQAPISALTKKALAIYERSL